jgi:hypothetical protein
LRWPYGPHTPNFSTHNNQTAADESGNRTEQTTITTTDNENRDKDRHSKAMTMKELNYCKEENQNNYKTTKKVASVKIVGKSNKLEHLKSQKGK